MFSNFKEAVCFIENIERKDKRINLSRISYAASLIDHPEHNYKIIHIAGTNGKGSTAKMCEAILMKKGHKVGLFTSPYVLKFNERIIINEEMISDEKVLLYANKIYPIYLKIKEENDDILTFFEYLTLMALLYFSDNSCDYAVIECGLGGLLDATNFIDSNLNIITNVDFDHMNSLGNTIESIATHKLGIVKPNSILVTEHNSLIDNMIINTCENKNSKLIFTGNYQAFFNKDYNSFSYMGYNYDLKLNGEYQIKNAIKAIEAISVLEGFDYDLFYEALKSVEFACRMECVSKKPLIYLDGGHNLPAIKNTLGFIDNIKVSGKRYVLYTALKDKAYYDIIPLLEKSFDYILITSIPDKRRTSDEEFIKYENEKTKYTVDYKDAYASIISKLENDDLLIIFGSLHFVSIIKNTYYK